MATGALHAGRRRRMGRLLGGAVLLLSLVGAVAGTTACGERAQAAPHLAKIDPVVHIDRTVTDGALRFDISTLVPNIGATHLGNVDYRAHGQFVLVHVEVTNVGQAPATVEESAQRIYDARGHAYTSDAAADYDLNTDEATSGNGTSAMFNPIPPGGRVDGTIAFDVPRHVHLTTLELHSAPGSAGVRVPLH